MISPEEEFEPVTLCELVLAVMSDGRWYTATLLRQRLRRYKGSITTTLYALRDKGYVQRARNPRWNGRPFHRVLDAPYAYKATGKPWKGFTAGFSWSKAQTKAARLQWERDRHMPKRWRELLK